MLDIGKSEIPAKDMVQALSSLAGDESVAKGLRILLGDLQLPNPMAGEYLPSRSGAIFFHPSAGVVLRLEHGGHKYGLSRHPLVLQPLAKYNVGEWQLEVCEGMRTNDITAAEVAWLDRALKHDHVYWADAFDHCGAEVTAPRQDNAGRLSVVSAEFPNGIPAVMDREEVHDFADSPHLAMQTMLFHSLKRSLRGAFNMPSRAPRLEDYGVSSKDATEYRLIRSHLGGTLNAAFDRKTGRFDQTLVSDFWALCEHHTATPDVRALPNGSFCRGWEEKVVVSPALNEKPVLAREVAMNFHDRILGATPPRFGI